MYNARSAPGATVESKITMPSSGRTARLRGVVQPGQRHPQHRGVPVVAVEHRRGPRPAGGVTSPGSRRRCVRRSTGRGRRGPVDQCTHAVLPDRLRGRRRRRHHHPRPTRAAQRLHRHDAAGAVRRPRRGRRRPRGPAVVVTGRGGASAPAPTSAGARPASTTTARSPRPPASCRRPTVATATRAAWWRCGSSSAPSR